MSAELENRWASSNEVASDPSSKKSKPNYLLYAFIAVLAILILLTCVTLIYVLATLGGGNEETTTATPTTHRNVHSRRSVDRNVNSKPIPVVDSVERDSKSPNLPTVAEENKPKVSHRRNHHRRKSARSITWNSKGKGFPNSVVDAKQKKKLATHSANLPATSKTTTTTTSSKSPKAPNKIRQGKQQKPQDKAPAKQNPRPAPNKKSQKNQPKPGNKAPPAQNPNPDSFDPKTVISEELIQVLIKNSMINDQTMIKILNREKTINETVYNPSVWNCGPDEFTKRLTKSRLENCPTIEPDLNKCCYAIEKCYMKRLGKSNCDHTFEDCIDKATAQWERCSVEMAIWPSYYDNDNYILLSNGIKL